MAAALRRAVAQRFVAAPQAYGMRRFMQERPAFRPTMPPDAGFMPLADRIRDHLGVSFPRINLDGLVPPAAPAPAPAPALTREEAREEVVGTLTVAEARKVLRATQMEAARARVVKAIEKAIHMPRALPVAENDPAREELKAMEAVKVDIDRTATLQVRRELWGGLAALALQTAGFMRLTFWELSWDVMEPICFFVTSTYFMAGYAFFLRTKREPSFEGFFRSRFIVKQKRLMKAREFDLRRYSKLRQACGLPALQSQSPCEFSQESHCHSSCHCH